MNETDISAVYILAFAPEKPAKFKNSIFQVGPGSIMELLQNPGELRNAGWDFTPSEKPKIIKGEYWEGISGNDTLFRLHTDGTFILRAMGSPNFLCWASNTIQYGEPRLHSIAVIEITYNFVEFCRKLIDYFIEKPTKVRFRMEIQNAHENNKKLYLLPYGPGTYMISSEKKIAPDNHVIREEDFNSIDLLNSGHITYRIMERLYTWFGRFPNEIPFVSKDDQGNCYIDADQIKKLR